MRPALVNMASRAVASRLYETVLNPFARQQRDISSKVPISGDLTTTGHLEVFGKRLEIAEPGDRVSLSIGDNPKKTYLCDLETRVAVAGGSIQEWLHKKYDQANPVLSEKIAMVNNGDITVEATSHTWLPKDIVKEQDKYGLTIHPARGARNEQDAVEEDSFQELWTEEIKKPEYEGKLVPTVDRVVLSSDMHHVSSSEKKRQYEVYALNKDNPRGQEARAAVKKMTMPSAFKVMSKPEVEERLLELESIKRHNKLQKQLKGSESIIIAGTTGGGKTTANNVLNGILTRVKPDKPIAVFNEDKVVAGAYDDSTVIKGIEAYLEEKGMDKAALKTEGKMNKAKISKFIAASDENKNKINEITGLYLADQMQKFTNENSEKFKLFDSPRYSKIISTDWFEKMDFKPNKVLFIDAEPQTRINRVNNREDQNNAKLYVGLQAEYPAGTKFKPAVGAAVGSELMWNRLQNQEAPVVRIDTTYSDERALKRDLEESLLTS